MLTNNNQIKVLLVSLDDEPVAAFSFPKMTESHGVFRIDPGDFSGAHQDIYRTFQDTKFRRLRLAIDKVHTGDSHDDTCVSVVVPWVY